MVLASLVKLPVAVMVTFPAVPGGSVVPSSELVTGSVPVLALLIWLPLVKVSVPTFIVMSPARPVSEVLLLIVAPFERLTLPTFSTTSPPRPSLTVLVAIEPLSRVNVFAVMVTWPASAMARLARDAAPAGDIDRVGIDGHIPSRRCGVHSTGLDHGPIRQADRLGMHRNVASTSRAAGYRRRCRNQILKGRQNPPCFPSPAVLAP